jgi:hypothetical protein
MSENNTHWKFSLLHAGGEHAVRQKSMDTLYFANQPSMLSKDYLSASSSAHSMPFP